MLRRLGAATAAVLIAVTLWPLAGAGREARAAEFLRSYVTDDGRVTRRDQGGDTVSEGQAYAMRIALDDGDEKRFLRVWRWTRQQLQRDDGLFAWRWREGAVVDAQPAADADVDIAAVLADAARAFDRPRLRREAVRIARAVLALETFEDGDRLLLAAGPWAVAPKIVNPSYSNLCAFRVLERATGDARWARLGEDFAATLRQLLREVRLPPDWATVRDGMLEPIGAPGRDDAPQYGLDAQRIALRAAPCSTRGHALARRLWPRLRKLPRHGGAVAYSLDGDSVHDARHPVGLLGAASAAAAAGEQRRSAALLRRAHRWHDRSATYYGAAWLALVEPELGAEQESSEDRAAAAGPVLVAARRVLPSGEPPSTGPSPTSAPTTTPTTTPPSTPPTTAPPTTTTTGPTTTTTRATTTTTRSTTSTTRRTTSSTRRRLRGRPVPPTAGPAGPPAAGPTRPPATERSRRVPSAGPEPETPATQPPREPAPAAPGGGTFGPLPTTDLLPHTGDGPEEAAARVRFRQVSALVAGSVGLTVIAGTALGLYERARLRRGATPP